MGIYPFLICHWLFPQQDTILNAIRVFFSCVTLPVLLNDTHRDFSKLVSKNLYPSERKRLVFFKLGKHNTKYFKDIELHVSYSCLGILETMKKLNHCANKNLSRQQKKTEYI